MGRTVYLYTELRYEVNFLRDKGVAGECTQLCGMHINEDWFIPEVIDPETEEVLPAGKKGGLGDLPVLGKKRFRS